MNNLFSKLESIWVSVAFAEAGEHEISKQVMAEEFFPTDDAESYVVI